MAQVKSETKPLSQLFQSEYLRAVFAAAERDNPPALVEPERPEPVLTGGDAVRVLDLA